MGVLRIIARRKIVICGVFVASVMIWIFHQNTKYLSAQSYIEDEPKEVANSKKVLADMRFNDFGVEKFPENKQVFYLVEEEGLIKEEKEGDIEALDKKAEEFQREHQEHSHEHEVKEAEEEDQPQEAEEEDQPQEAEEEDQPQGGIQRVRREPDEHKAPEDDTIDKLQSSSNDMEPIFRHGKEGNYEIIETRRVYSQGQMGHGVSVKEVNQESMRLYGCDMQVSDLIPLNRTIRDTRDPECKYWWYLSNLPSASVVIVFHNEGLSTLLRTVQSVINRTPVALLTELILVDDASTMDHLKEPLRIYIMRFRGKVKLIRNNQRMGIVGARMIGIREAVGDVVVVLDSHCECNINWLPPLLQRIARNPKTLAVPIVDMIDNISFEYSTIKILRRKRGAFDWGLKYKHIYLTDAEMKAKQHESQPHKSPTHEGGLFAIHRQFFLQIGGYDPHLQIWGGENMQLSFKIWMCGGQIEIVPCSRVGHVYKSHIPYSLEPDPKEGVKIPAIKYNYLRVVEGWMDEYKENFYLRQPDLRGYRVSVEDELKLRSDLGCHSFDWYMKTVAQIIPNYFPYLKPNVAWGMLRLIGTPSCMWRNGEAVQLLPCQGLDDQIFRRNTEGQLANDEYCVAGVRKSYLHAVYCQSPYNQLWIWRDDKHQIQSSERDYCITATTADVVFLHKCEEDNVMQRWEFVEHRSWSQDT